MILVTGGAGFIGSNFILEWLRIADETVINLDKLTYAGNLANLASLENDSRHIFVHGDICDASLITSLLKKYRPRAIVHFAAESHVDRSIHGPAEFIQSNVFGTFNLLECARDYFGTISPEEKRNFRFLHISTDEVYGTLGYDSPAFTEKTAYAPSSPYSASKAASDHFVRIYYLTYGVPTIITNCSNNFGPFQFPEKLVALTIINALQGKSIPVYGDGQQVRDWLYVSDHCSGIRAALELGRPGETYNIGGMNEKKNIEVVRTICSILDELVPSSNGSYSRLISFIKDRPGHDYRYAINPEKMRCELGWSPEETFETGMRKTVKWYLDNTSWVESILSKQYYEWIDVNYTKRSGDGA